MIRKKLSLYALVTLGALALSTGTNAATYTAGDMILGFGVSGGVGATSNILVDIGSSITFRDLNGASSLNIVTIGTYLDQTFGTTAGNGVAWNERTDLYWGVVACRSNVLGAVVSGDPTRTVYASAARTGLGTLGSANSSDPSNGAMSGSDVSGAANAIVALAGTTFASATAAGGSGGKVAIINTSVVTSNNWTTDNASSPYFNNIPGSVQQAFTAGTIGSYGAAGAVDGAIDLYRILQTTTGASPSGTVGTGTFLTTLTIDSSGNVSAVPEPSTYALLGLGAVVGFIAIRRKRVSC